MLRVALTEPEVAAVKAVVATAVARYRASDYHTFLTDAVVMAHELPRRLREQLIDFKLRECDQICVISGYPVDEGRIGRTPAHWKLESPESSTIDEQTLLILLGSVLGDVFGWATQQDGHIVHDVLPIKGHEHEQLGSSSEELLWWHTEDAFHPYFGDYIGLMCLRNPDNVATTVATYDPGRLTPEQRALLAESRFTIRPDESHLPKNQSDAAVKTGNGHLGASYEHIEEMNRAPSTIPVLFGSPEGSYLRIDPYFMDLDKLDETSRAAIDCVSRQLEANLSDLVLRPGEICFIDNLRAVHGRKPFKARHDGTDRWLKRINITRDLRKSRRARLGPDARLIY